jgi:hypothetical protein
VQPRGPLDRNFTSGIGVRLDEAMRSVNVKRVNYLVHLMLTLLAEI